MSIGEKFATKNEVEVIRRKLQLALSGATIVQHAPDIVGVSNFIELSDVPGAYTAAGNFITRVKSTVDELEFAELKGTTNQVYVTANAADYTLSLPQDIHTGASPTFVTVKLSALTDGYVPYHVSDAAGLANSPIQTNGTIVGVGMTPVTAQLEVNTSQIITSTTAAPYLQIVNKSDTERDPIIQYAVGATPVVKHTIGIDDSDYNSYKIAVGSALGVAYGFYGTYPNEYIVGDVLRISGDAYDDAVLNRYTTFYGDFKAGYTLHPTGTTQARLYAYKEGIEWAHIYVGEIDEDSQIEIASDDIIQIQARSINSGERIEDSGCLWYHAGSFFIGHSEPHTDVLGFQSSDGEVAYLNFKSPVVAAAADVTWTLPATDSTGIQALVSDGAGNLSWSSFTSGGGVNEYRYYADLADDAVLTLPFSITSSARGFIAAGNNEERSDFWIDNDGDVTLVNNSANVVANADNDAKLDLGTAAAQEPLQIKNRLGATKKIFIVIWYN